MADAAQLVKFTPDTARVFQSMENSLLLMARKTGRTPSFGASSTEEAEVRTSKVLDRISNASTDIARGSDIQVKALFGKNPMVKLEQKRWIERLERFFDRWPMFKGIYTGIRQINLTTQETFSRIQSAWSTYFNRIFGQMIDSFGPIIETAKAIGNYLKRISSFLISGMWTGIRNTFSKLFAAKEEPLETPTTDKEVSKMSGALEDVGQQQIALLRQILKSGLHYNWGAVGTGGRGGMKILSPYKSDELWDSLLLKEKKRKPFKITPRTPEDTNWQKFIKIWQNLGKKIFNFTTSSWFKFIGTLAGLYTLGKIIWTQIPEAWKEQTKKFFKGLSDKIYEMLPKTWQEQITKFSENFEIFMKEPFYNLGVLLAKGARKLWPKIVEVFSGVLSVWTAAWSKSNPIEKLVMIFGSAFIPIIGKPIRMLASGLFKLLTVSGTASTTLGKVGAFGAKFTKASVLLTGVISALELIPDMWKISKGQMTWGDLFKKRWPSILGAIAGAILFKSMTGAVLGYQIGDMFTKEPKPLENESETDRNIKHWTKKINEKMPSILGAFIGYRMGGPSGAVAGWMLGSLIEMPSTKPLQDSWNDYFSGKNMAPTTPQTTPKPPSGVNPNRPGGWPNQTPNTSGPKPWKAIKEWISSGTPEAGASMIPQNYIMPSPITTPQIGTKTGGTLSWRNNNPGNLKASAYVQKMEGYIDKDSQGHAIFDSEEHGRLAHIKALFESRWASMPLDKVIQQYAEDNNGYLDFVLKQANIQNKLMREYSSEERQRMQLAIQKREGWEQGTTFTPTELSAIPVTGKQPRSNAQNIERAQRDLVIAKENTNQDQTGSNTGNTSNVNIQPVTSNSIQTIQSGGQAGNLEFAPHSIFDMPVYLNVRMS